MRADGRRKAAREMRGRSSRAVEALTGFHFGATTSDRLLLAEAQPAWIAERSAARMVQLSRVMREGRGRASQRYGSLWDERARGQPAAPTT